MSWSAAAVQVLTRLTVTLRLVLAILAVALLVLVVGGVLLRPASLPGGPAVAGRVLLQQRGTGPQPGTAAVRVPGHALGVAFRCEGAGSLRVTFNGVGYVEGGCDRSGTGDSGFVLSRLQQRSVDWKVTTAAGNRWNVALTRPVLLGSLQP